MNDFTGTLAKTQREADGVVNVPVAQVVSPAGPVEAPETVITASRMLPPWMLAALFLVLVNL